MRFQSKGFELLVPFRRRITKSLDSNTARQATFDRGADEIRCEESERDCHVDLTHTALLTCCDPLNVGHGARNDLVKPTTPSGDGADEARATFDPRWTDFTFGDASGIRICLDFLDGGFCHGIESKWLAVSRVSCFFVVC